MKTGIKVLISVVAGLVVAWVCYQVLHLDQPISTILSIVMTSATWGICEKVGARK
jgi:xanthosine utilization system XapX-like protein